MTNLNDLVAAVDEPQNAEKQSKAERAFVRRLDIFLLTFGCISQGTSRAIWQNALSL